MLNTSTTATAIHIHHRPRMGCAPKRSRSHPTDAPNATRMTPPMKIGTTKSTNTEEAEFGSDVAGTNGSMTSEARLYRTRYAAARISAFHHRARFQNLFHPECSAPPSTRHLHIGPEQRANVIRPY